MTQTFYLIRHGQTDFSKRRKYCGATDVELNSLGILQARQLAEVLSGASIQTVYASPLQRAAQSSRMAFPHKEPRFLTGLSEIDFGCFEGMTHEELIRKYPVQYTQWMNDPCAGVFPRGEAFDLFVQRVRNTWREIVSQNDTCAAVVTHGGPLKIIAGEILGLSLNKSLRLQFDEASISTLERSGDTWNILGMNETLIKSPI